MSQLINMAQTIKMPQTASSYMFGSAVAAGHVLVDRTTDSDPNSMYERGVEVIDEIITVGDESLADDSILAEDLNFAVAMDGMLLQLETLRFSLQARSRVNGSNSNAAQLWRELVQRLLHLRTDMKEVVDLNNPWYGNLGNLGCTGLKKFHGLLTSPISSSSSDKPCSVVGRTEILGELEEDAATIENLCSRIEAREAAPDTVNESLDRPEAPQTSSGRYSISKMSSNQDFGDDRSTADKSSSQVMRSLPWTPGPLESGRRGLSLMPLEPQRGSSNALLHLDSVHPRIEDWSIGTDVPKSDFAIRAYKFPGMPTRLPRSLPFSYPPERLDSSFTVEVPTLSGLPSLGTGTSIGSSSASAAENRSSIDTKKCHVDATSKENLTHTTQLTCLFKFLGCTETFAGSAEEWYEHSKTHLRGRSPPSFLRCPYASCPWTVSGVEAWELRWAHLQQTHDLMSDGENVCEKRDGQLFEYLWKARLISSAQLQELRRSGRLGIQAGTRDASPVSSDHRQQETSLRVFETSTVRRKRKGRSLGDTTSGSSVGMATSIHRPLIDRISNYRLTRETIGRELQILFPGYDLRAFDIQVDICVFVRLRFYRANAELGVRQSFHFLSTPKADNGAQTSTLLGALTLTNFYQDQRDGILARRMQDD